MRNPFDVWHYLIGKLWMCGVVSAWGIAPAIFHSHELRDVFGIIALVFFAASAAMMILFWVALLVLEYWS